MLPNEPLPLLTFQKHSQQMPKSSVGETGALRRKFFPFSLMSAKFSHRCRSMTTIAAIERPIAVAVCLVAQRARSMVRQQVLQGTVVGLDPDLLADLPGRPATPQWRDSSQEYINPDWILLLPRLRLIYWLIDLKPHTLPLGWMVLTTC